MSKPGLDAPITGELSHIAAFVCHTSPGRRLRHPDGSGTLGAHRREDDHDLHARVESRPGGGPQAGRSAAATVNARSRINRLIERGGLVQIAWQEDRAIIRTKMSSAGLSAAGGRSEERRVGKECRL